MSLKTIRDSFHTQLLNYRNTHRLIVSDDFTIAYENASVTEKGEIERAVKRVDKLTVRRFIKCQLLKSTPFHRMTIKQLREIGRNIQISEYWEKDKITLIKEIEHAVKESEKNSKRVLL